MTDDPDGPANPRPPAGPSWPGNRRRADGRRRDVAQPFGAGAARTLRSRHGPHAALEAVGLGGDTGFGESGACSATDGRFDPGNGTPEPLRRRAWASGRPETPHDSHPAQRTPREDARASRHAEGVRCARGTDGRRSPLDAPTVSLLEEKETPHGRPHLATGGGSSHPPRALGRWAQPASRRLAQKVGEDARRKPARVRRPQWEVRSESADRG